MLEIKHVTKVYETESLKQTALDDVSINFRKSEFASILGPSGSGKTTLLNIIGGLDKYTSGDLIINGISTKKYKDSDWDSYRNHRIGFVFQNYNLISHQTILKNVELALTISGISKKERLRRAKDALIEVGLEEHINKKPNQLSGGQMQRVAIARALVNNPDILLADEPTGALDSATSIQIMNILKEISSKKLVVMVTHNPELANEYSSRIIELKDGKITKDTKPFKSGERERDLEAKTGKTSMSFFTALGLSFNNLMTKKGRTILTALAGSIGIIGIALILSLSTGFQKYIDKIQEDTMSSYPLTIISETADMSSLLMSMISTDYDEEATKDSDKLFEKQFVSNMFASVSKNDLKSFKKYLETNFNKVKDSLTSVKYSYSIDPIIYTKDMNNEITQVNPNKLFTSMYSSMGASSLFSSYSSIFYQMIDDEETINEQYKVLAGHLPKKHNEMVIVLSQEHMIPDFILYFLGYKDMDELTEVITKAMAGETVEINSTPMELTYDDLLNKEFKLINPSDKYRYNKEYDIYEDMSDDESFMKKVYDNSETLKISGIVIAKDGKTSMTLPAGIAYKSDLVTKIISDASNSLIVKKQLANKDIDIFSGKRFDDTSKKESGLNFEDFISIDKEMLANAFGMNVDENTIKSMTVNYMSEIQEEITTNTTPAENDFSNALGQLSNLLVTYIKNNPPKQKTINTGLQNITMDVMYMSDIEPLLNGFFQESEVTQVLQNIEDTYVVPATLYSQTLNPLYNAVLNGYIGVMASQNQSFEDEIIPQNIGAPINELALKGVMLGFTSSAEAQVLSKTLASGMTEAKVKKNVMTKVGELVTRLTTTIASGFNVDQNKIANAFKFNLSESELTRIISTMMGSVETSTQSTNLLTLGYQDIDEPTSISLYFKDFESKENVLRFIDEYNEKMEKNEEDEKVINYTDTAGILISSVKKIVNAISYALIAFVAISLVVSSIMIGIITYISVLERTKEIGILRAIGASKGNVSSIFNAETFIIGLLSGGLGIGVSLIFIPIINATIHKLTDNYDINAILPIKSAILLIVLSIILTLIGGLIPSKKASKQDPVVALRTE